MTYVTTWSGLIPADQPNLLLAVNLATPVLGWVLIPEIRTVTVDFDVVE
jgi:hypothetical protein